MLTAGAAGDSATMRRSRPASVKPGSAVRAADIAASVALSQAQTVLGDVVQDHLAAYRSGLEHAGDEPQVGEPELVGQAVAAVHLERAVECSSRRVAGREL